jgi:hypothetical protein
MTRLHDALTARFTDADEIKDVANYGCSGGVSGFIYSSELYDFFQEHEDDIEDTLDLFDVQYDDLVADAQTFQQYREAAVWFVVEQYCQDRVLEAEALAA